MVTIAKEDGKRWLVIKTRARAEKKVARFCDRLGVSHYLPLRRSVRRYQGRAVVHDVPIFTGYVFAQIALAELGQLEELRHVAHCMVPDLSMEKGLIRELNDLQLLSKAAADGELMVRPEIEAGKLVTITHGPMSGLSGVVVRRKKQTRVAVNVEMIGQSVSIEADVGELEIDW